MRLWSISFEYLDSKGLVALWREALLAKKVLEGRTKGYTKHPQLARFRAFGYPLKAINTYLYYVRLEAGRRKYNFDAEKIDSSLIDLNIKMKISLGQLNYEFGLLKSKVEKRDLAYYKKLLHVKRIEPNQLFYVISGPVAEWEKVK